MSACPLMRLDSSLTESFSGSIKRELLDGQPWPTHADARGAFTVNRPGFGGDFLSWKDDLHAEAVPERTA
jgi:hypothetical protein